MVLWPWCCGHGVVAMVLWPWCCGHGVVAMVLWPWCCGHGVHLFTLIIMSVSENPSKTPGPIFNKTL